MSSKRYPFQPPRGLIRARQRVIVIEDRPLPAFMKRLSLLCHRHPLPLPMVFAEEAVLTDGTPVAVYRCSYHACRHREYWMAHPVTGQPVRFWEGPLPGQR